MISTTSSDSEAELVARLRSVWPEPVPLTARRGFGRGAGTPYLVLPSLRRPILLVPADSRAAATAIRRVDDGQRTEIGSRVLAWAQQHRLLRLLPGMRVLVGDPEASRVVAAVRAAVPEAHTVVVRLGRPRHGRAVVLQALAADGRSLAFGKCGFGAARADGLRRERDVLTSLGHQAAPGLRAPRVLGFDHAEDHAVLIIEALVPTRPAAGPDVPVAAMRGLAERDGLRSSPVGDTLALGRLRAEIDALEEGETRDWLRGELERFLVELGEEHVEVGSWHGDWVAWNMARDGDEVLLWDWEHHADGVPLGLDHLHYLAQNLRSRVGTTEAVEDRWLVAARSALARHWGVRGRAASATLRCYLLIVNARYASDRRGAVDARPRAGWSRGLVQRLFADSEGSTAP